MLPFPFGCDNRSQSPHRISLQRSKHPFIADITAQPIRFHSVPTPVAISSTGPGQACMVKFKTSQKLPNFFDCQFKNFVSFCLSFTHRFFTFTIPSLNFYASPLSRMEYRFIRVVDYYCNDDINNQDDEFDGLDKDDLYRRLAEFEDLDDPTICEDHTDRIEELQNDLALMLDQWTSISIVLSSMQTTFMNTPESSQGNEDIWREMRAASDYLMAQIRKLEKRILTAEQEILDLQQSTQCVATP
jgi:hypothetical protein